MSDLNGQGVFLVTIIKYKSCSINGNKILVDFNESDMHLL